MNQLFWLQSQLLYYNSFYLVSTHSRQKWEHHTSCFLPVRRSQCKTLMSSTSTYLTAERKSNNNASKHVHVSFRVRCTFEKNKNKWLIMFHELFCTVGVKWQTYCNLIGLSLMHVLCMYWQLNASLTSRLWIQFTRFTDRSKGWN